MQLYPPLTGPVAILRPTQIHVWVTRWSEGKVGDGVCRHGRGQESICGECLALRVTLVMVTIVSGGSRGPTREAI